MAKNILWVLVTGLLLVGCANQETEGNPDQNSSGKMEGETNGNPPGKVEEKNWVEGLKENFSVSNAKSVSAMTIAVYLLMGGVLGLYIRFLYRQCNGSVSDADSVARIFPLLTIVTIGVIAVVKSSWTLSLGLLGALSIVRFRAAIKDPEELVYLFLCIGVGLALGAEQPLLALVVVVAATVFIVGIHFASGKGRQQNLLLTISGDAEKYFGEESGGVLAVVDELVGSYSLQRFDIEQGRGQVRIVINQKSGSETAALIAQLRKQLPECEFSYVNLESTF